MSQVMAALVNHVNYLGLSPGRNSEPLKDFWQKEFYGKFDILAVAKRLDQGGRGKLTINTSTKSLIWTFWSL